MIIISCSELQTLLDSGAVLLDVRTEMEYNTSRLPGATLIPLNQLQNARNQLPHTATVLVYCRSGHRSEYATEMLKNWGFNAKNIGGIMHYRDCAEY